MPLPHYNWSHRANNSLISAQLDYNVEYEHDHALNHIELLNPDQLDAFNAIITSVNTQTGNTFFLFGPASTGKAFVYQTLCHHL